MLSFLFNLIICIYQFNKSHIQVIPDFVTKILQIYDCKLARHGNMIVGKTGSGKSEAWKALQRALTKLKETNGNNENF